MQIQEGRVTWTVQFEAKLAKVGEVVARWVKVKQATEHVGRMRLEENLPLQGPEGSYLQR